MVGGLVANMNHQNAASSGNSPLSNICTPSELSTFAERGFLIIRGLAEPQIVSRILAVTRMGLETGEGPVEFEADLGYPGSPASRDQPGGRTIRRLKHAQGRDPVFTEWLAGVTIVGRLQQLLGPRICMPLAHHNCIMTKHPRFSSETGWHQDIRYWSYCRPELVSLWLALGAEHPENGGLWVIPGTHQLQLHRERFDEHLFLRQDLPENQHLISQREAVLLEAGDVLLFHARTFHAAGRNTTTAPKFSAVFTFRAGDNPPIPGSRSASLPELILTPGA